MLEGVKAMTEEWRWRPVYVEDFATARRAAGQSMKPLRSILKIDSSSRGVTTPMTLNPNVT
jgi:hypothetical protein